MLVSSCSKLKPGSRLCHADNTWYCQPGSTWTSLGTYARCCTTAATECMLPTACVNTSILVGPNSQQIETCSGSGAQTTCLTGTIYDYAESPAAVKNYDCWPSWTAGTATSWDATRTTSRGIVSTARSASITPAQSYSLSNHEEAAETEGETSPPSSLSPGIIAGMVVGIVVGILAIAAIGAMLVVVFRRKAAIQESGEPRIIYIQSPAAPGGVLCNGVGSDCGKAELPGSMIQAQHTPRA